MLQRGGVGVSLTPKMYEMLVVLVRNHGKVLEKDRLLQEVWPDSFVEEGNIAYNIRQLRKILADDVQAPTYIETIPRRGYRFIAPVEEITETPEEPAVSEAADPVPAAHEAKHSFSVPIIFGLLIIAVLVGGWYLLTGGPAEPGSLIEQPFAAEKLSTSGMVFGASISPDGKRVVYSSRSGVGQGLWMRELESGNNVPIVPPSDDNYYEVLFAPDGNSIFFTRGVRGRDDRIDLFRISAIGGVPEKIVDFAEGALSVSPDGASVSFVRCPRQSTEWCSLWIANSKDGSDQRQLFVTQDPVRIGDVEFSPDGKRIAFASGQSRNASNDFHLSEIELESGRVRELTSESFFNVKNLTWLPDQSGLLITASRIPNKYFRIWRVSLPSGAAEPLTKDSEAYSILSLDRQASRLVATQIKQDFRLYAYEMAHPGEKRFLADGVWPTFSPDGRIYFASIMSGNDEIWTIAPDGSGQRQLTTDVAGDGSPIPSADGRTIFFASNRTREAQVWQMNADGSGQVQLTQQEGGQPLFAPPDGRSLYYGNALKGGLWRVLLDSGEQTPVLDNSYRDFFFAPQGDRVASWERTEAGISVIVRSLPEGVVLNKFELPNGARRLIDAAWMPDGRALLCLTSDLEYENGVLYLQPDDGSTAKMITDLKDEPLSEIGAVAVAPDGKRFVLVLGSWRHDAVLITGLK